MRWIFDNYRSAAATTSYWRANQAFTFLATYFTQHSLWFAKVLATFSGWNRTLRSLACRVTSRPPAGRGWLMVVRFGAQPPLFLEPHLGDTAAASAG